MRHNDWVGFDPTEKETSVLENLFIPDFAPPPETPRPKLVALKVCFQVLHVAWEDVHRDAFRDRGEKLDAMQWFASDLDHEFSFPNICHVLGERFNCDAIRERLKRAGRLNPNEFAARIINTTTRTEWERGMDSRRYKLTPADVVEMREMIAAGVPKRLVARTKGIDQRHLNLIQRGGAWANV